MIRHCGYCGEAQHNRRSCPRRAAGEPAIPKWYGEPCHASYGHDGKHTKGECPDRGKIDNRSIGGSWQLPSPLPPYVDPEDSDRYRAQSLAETITKLKISRDTIYDCIAMIAKDHIPREDNDDGYGSFWFAMDLLQENY